MKTQVYLLGNRVINVGPWDEQRRNETRVVLGGEVICVGSWDFGERTELRLMKGGKCLGVINSQNDAPEDPEVLVESVLVIDNPLPAGAVVEEFEVVGNPIPADAVLTEIDIATTAKGRIVASDDYRSRRADEYPSVGDQLDAFWKGGEDAAAMLGVIASIKSKYPKVS